MKQKIFDEINRLYAVERKFNNLLEELSQLIVHKTNKSFNEIYNDIITKYFFNEDNRKDGTR